MVQARLASPPHPHIMDTYARPEDPLVDAGSRIRWIERLRFLREFALRPREMGAVAPSSPDLAEAMLHGLDLEMAAQVVELGAGTGAFTSVIVQRLPQSARFMAMELNPRLAVSLRRRFADKVEVVCDSAEELCRYLEEATVGGVDAIVSSLPWVCFPPELRRSILQEIRRALRPGGRFSTFAYAHAAWLPSGRKFRRELRSVFAKSEILPVVWRNLPPAFIYRCENDGYVSGDN